MHGSKTTDILNILPVNTTHSGSLVYFEQSKMLTSAIRHHGFLGQYLQTSFPKRHLALLYYEGNWITRVKETQTGEHPEH